MLRSNGRLSTVDGPPSTGTKPPGLDALGGFVLPGTCLTAEGIDWYGPLMDGYPPCSNPDCDYTLCFMERRDWDSCPACEYPIPAELRLDNEFRPVPVDRPAEEG